MITKTDSIEQLNYSPNCTCNETLSSSGPNSNKYQFRIRNQPKMIIKTLIFVSLCLLGQVFGQSWLEGLLNARNEAQGTSESKRPTILLTYGDQTTDCCAKIDILPTSELSRCAKANSNVSSTAIEQHKVCISLSFRMNWCMTLTFLSTKVHLRMSYHPN